MKDYKIKTPFNAELFRRRSVSGNTYDKKLVKFSKGTKICFKIVDEYDSVYEVYFPHGCFSYMKKEWVDINCQLVKSREDEKRTSEEWLKELGDELPMILDPDGWDRSDFDYSFYVERIDLATFMKRVDYSTTYNKADKLGNSHLIRGVEIHKENSKITRKSRLLKEREIIYYKRSKELGRNKREILESACMYLPGEVVEIRKANNKNISKYLQIIKVDLDFDKNYDTDSLVIWDSAELVYAGWLIRKSDNVPYKWLGRCYESGKNLFGDAYYIYRRIEVGNIPKPSDKVLIDNNSFVMGDKLRKIPVIPTLTKLFDE